MPNKTLQRTSKHRGRPVREMNVCAGRCGMNIVPVAEPGRQKRHMVFALDKDNGGLLAFSTPVETDAQCKRIDVRDGFWLFFDEDGSPLEARFEHMNQSDDSVDPPGAYTLERPMSGLWLQERLAQVVTVKGCGITTVAELVETLKINRGKRVNRLASPR